MVGLAEYFNNLDKQNFAKEQAFAENLMANERMGLAGRQMDLQERVGDQNIARNRQSMENAIQDRAIKAYTMFNDMVGGAAMLDDPEQYKQALDLAYASPLSQLVDPQKEQYEFLSNHENAKKILPALQGYSALAKQGVDRQKLALESQRVINQIESLKQRGEGFMGSNERMARIIMEEEAAKGNEIGFEEALIRAKGFGANRAEAERQIQFGKTSGKLGAEAEGRGNVISAEETEKRRQEAITNFPKVERTVNQFSNLANNIINDPDLDIIFGPIDAITPDLSQKANDLEAMRERITSQAFLNQFEQLKGAGQITEIEGKKATDALLNASRAQSVEQFIENVLIAEDVLQQGFNSLRQIAQTGRPEGIEEVEQSQDKNNDPLGLF